MPLSRDTFSAAGGAVSDIFAGFGYETSAEGKRLEAGNYDAAAAFAHQNAIFTKSATEVKEYQANRDLEKSVGTAEATIADNNFAQSGSALDILRESFAQGALQKALLGQQGAIQEASFEEQARSYSLMAESSRLAADAADTAAIGSYISGGIKGLTAIFSLGMPAPAPTG